MHEKIENTSNSNELRLDESSPDKVDLAFKDEYLQLQRRLILAILLITVFAGLITALFFEISFAISLLLGSISGVLYIRLLARSIGKLGKSSRSVGKVQLLVPVLLVVAVSKLPQLDLIPALLGFLLYKPAIFLQALLES